MKLVLWTACAAALGEVCGMPAIEDTALGAAEPRLPDEACEEALTAAPPKPTAALSSVSAAEATARHELAAAYRLFGMYGLAPYDGETINFIAARIPGEDAFLINDYRLLWEEITASSLRRVPLREADRSDEQGKPGVRRAWFNEASLEGATAMFQNRSEAACFLHTHTLATSTVGSLEGGLLPVSQPGIMLANDVAHSHFDFFQPGDETVAAMGGKRAMLQKWHGAFVAGASLGQCFYIALSLDRACEAQRALLSTGAPFHVPAPADVARWSQAYVDDPFYGGYDGERVWEGMLRKARRLQPDFAQ